MRRVKNHPELPLGLEPMTGAAKHRKNKSSSPGRRKRLSRFHRFRRWLWNKVVRGAGRGIEGATAKVVYGFIIFLCIWLSGLGNWAYARYDAFTWKTGTWTTVVTNLSSDRK